MAEERQGARQNRKQAICRKAQRRHSNFYERCAHWSFNRSGEIEPIRWHRERLVLAGTALLITVLSGFIMPAWASAMRPAPTPEIHSLLPLALPKVAPSSMTTPTVDDWQVVRVQPGQTLSDIFNARGLGMTDLQRVLDRLTTPGAIYLGIITVAPLALLGFTRNVPFPFGGTAVLILVGVGLEFVKQVESQLTMRNYEGFLR